MDQWDEVGSGNGFKSLKWRDSPLAKRPPVTCGEAAVPHGHVAQVSWSSVPGICGLCGAPASPWSFTAGGPPWLPSDPQARLHLRLLWGFYSSSLPGSCTALRGAIKVEELSVLRAEATVLSLISLGLGFNSLSLSAKRLAEVCDVYDAGGPNPAWGSHHPLATMEELWVPPAVLAGSQHDKMGYRDHRRLDNSSISSCNSSKSSINNSICNTSERASHLYSDGHRTAAHRHSVHLNEALNARDEATKSTAGTEAQAAREQVAPPEPINRGDCGSMKGPCPSASQRRRKQFKMQKQTNRHSREEKKPKGDEHQQHVRQERRQHKQRRQHSKHLIETEEQQQQQRHLVVQQGVWERVAALRLGIFASRIRLRGHPVNEALVACLSDLHAAKQHLAVLFENATKNAAANQKVEEVAVAAGAKTKRAREIKERERLAKTQPQRSQGRAAAAVAAAAAIVRRLGVTVSSAIGSAVAAAKWLQCLSPNVCAIGLTGCRILGGLSALVSYAAAATGAKPVPYSLSIVQNISFSTDWVRDPATAVESLSVKALCFTDWNFVRGHVLLQHLLQRLLTTLKRETKEGWKTLCYLAKLLVLPLYGVLQQLEKIQEQLLLQWQIPGMDICREAFIIWASGSNRSGRSSRGNTSWATPENLNRGASTPPCDAFADEKPPVFYRERLLDNPSSFSRPPLLQGQHKDLQHRQFQYQLHPQQYTQQFRVHQQQQLLLPQHVRHQQSHLGRPQEQSHFRSPKVFRDSFGFFSEDVGSDTTDKHRRGEPGDSLGPSPLQPAGAVHGEASRCTSHREIGDGPKGLSLARGQTHHAAHELNQESLSQGDSVGLRRTKSFRRLSKATTTRAAAAGAAAAAATASWSIATIARNHSGTIREPPRHVSFFLENVASRRQSAAARDNANIYYASGVAGTQIVRQPDGEAIQRYISGVYAPQEDSSGLWGEASTGTRPYGGYKSPTSHFNPIL